MKCGSNYYMLLRITMPFLALFLYMGCSDDGIQVIPEIQPARLIRVTSYNSFQDITYQHLPKGAADGILSPQDWLELVFDKSVSQAIIDVDSVLGYLTPNGIPPTTTWTIRVRDLDLPSLPYFSDPKKNVPVTVIYEDKNGIHKETFETALGDYEPGPEPPQIVSANVRNDQDDTNAEQLNQEGIKFEFYAKLDVLRSQIEVYSGQKRLNWRISWIYKGGLTTATLFPDSDDDRFLPGREYEIHVVDFYSFWGTRGEGLEDGPLVIRFQTASVEPQPDGE